MRRLRDNWKIILILTMLAIAIFPAVAQPKDFSAEVYAFIRNHWQTVLKFYTESPVYSVLIYSLVYVLFAAINFPVAVPLTLLGGMLFGFWKATMVISLAATVGAAASFLIARYLARSWVQERFSKEFQLINSRLISEGSYYLFGLRLSPIFPFFLINILFGISRMSLKTFFLISYIGMLPGTMLYVNAACQLTEFAETKNFLSPTLLLSLIAIAFAPLILKRIFSYLKSDKF